MSTPGRGRVVAVLVALGLLAAALTACSSARTDVGTVDESCYLALPTAAKAVGGHAHLAGVRKFSPGGLAAIAPRLSASVRDELPKGTSVCLAAYTGHFTSAAVTKPLGRRAGSVAVVGVTTPGGTLLGTLILARFPVGFEHIF